MGKLTYNGNMRMWRGTLDTPRGELLISVPEKTFYRHINAYLQSKGISTMSYLQLMDYVHQVLDQRCQAAELLSNLEYWHTCDDPEVLVVQLTYKHDPGSDPRANLDGMHDQENAERNGINPH